MKEIITEKEAKDLFEQPLAILFKHSTQCPISAAAEQQMERFLSVHPKAPVYLIDVLKRWELSQSIAERTGIRHESPQVIVLQYGKPAWHASHYDITAGDLEQATVDFR